MEPLVIPSAFSNIVRTMHVDPVTGGFAIKTHEDVSGLIESNKAHLSANPKGLVQGDGDMRRVAHIPLSVINQIKEETGLDLLGMSGQDLDPDQWAYLSKNYLNNGEFSAIRTSEGKV